MATKWCTARLFQLVSSGVYVTVLLLAGCRHPDYTVSLPNGYRLARTNAFTTFIYRPYCVDGVVVEDRAVVPAKIVELNVRGDIVVGRIEHSPNSGGWGRTEPGYFILDTRKHQVQLGLDRESWKAALQSVAIDKPPSLKKPSRNFTWQ